MNLDTLTQIVGPINRGQLASGFIQEETTVDKRREPVQHVREEKPPPLTEDYSHFSNLNMKRAGVRPGFRCNRAEILRRCLPKLRPVYASILDRGETPATLARKIGIHYQTISSAFSGRGSERMKRRIAGVLTKGEVKMLGWRV